MFWRKAKSATFPVIYEVDRTNYLEALIFLGDREASSLSALRFQVNFLCGFFGDLEFELDLSGLSQCHLHVPLAFCFCPERAVCVHQY